MKHLIYLIDGTWVFAGRLRGENKYSNIYHLSNSFDYRDENESPQIIHYIRGIGATKGIRKYSSGGFGYAINENIQDIYLNICANYEPGDKIYVFGFSRGAVVARALCGMLDFGILKPDRIEYLKDVWNCYKFTSISDKNERLGNGIDHSSFQASREAILNRVQVEPPQVSFLGLFDTVLGGRGMTRSLQELNILPGVLPKCVNASVALHALDETRPFFLPQTFRSLHPENPAATLEQIWLPGVHTDIGGGYNHSGLSDISLIIMLDRIANATALSFNAKAFEDRVFGTSPYNIKVNSEYHANGLWFLRGMRKRRVLPQELNLVHPIVDDLVRTNIIFKGRETRYERPDLSEYPRCRSLISRRYREKRFSVSE